MSSLPTWAMSLIVATATLLSPVFGFLIAIGVEMLIGVLKAPFTTIVANGRG
jgi:hypothetical protein